MKHKIKTAFYLFCVVFCLAGCSKRGTKNMITQEIKLDDAHNIGITKDPNTLSYKIGPCERLLINRDNFRITQELNPKSEEPNAIHIIKSHSQNYYRAEWKDSGEISLSQSSLVSLNNSPIFSGFREGERYIIAIGCDNFGKKGAEKLVFQSMWVGTIEITAR